jgi:hypothetical protein
MSWYAVGAAEKAAGLAQEASGKLENISQEMLQQSERISRIEANFPELLSELKAIHALLEKVFGDQHVPTTDA